MNPGIRLVGADESTELLRYPITISTFTLPELNPELTSLPTWQNPPEEAH